MIGTCYEQQKYMYDHRCHTVPGRIVSVSQPFLRPIVRGKAGKPVEFGAKFGYQCGKRLGQIGVLLL